MSSESVLDRVIDESDGILISSDAFKAGVSKDQLYSYVKNNRLSRIAHGIYITEGSWEDEMYILQLRFPKAVFSHETALYLHDLAEREPVPFTVTVPAKYHAPALSELAKVVYVRDIWYELGICERETPDGHKVKVYDPERTVCDLIRKKDDTDPAVFNHALNEYVKSREKDYLQLTKYAKEFRIEEKLRMIMGVIL